MIAEGRDLAKHFNCKFIETSAKQRINVDEAFTNLVREIRRYNRVRLMHHGSNLCANAVPQEQVGVKPEKNAPMSAGIGQINSSNDDPNAGCCGGCIIA